MFIVNGNHIEISRIEWLFVVVVVTIKLFVCLTFASIDPTNMMPANPNQLPVAGQEVPLPQARVKSTIPKVKLLLIVLCCDDGIICVLCRLCLGRYQWHMDVSIAADFLQFIDA
jgi:hypothetical protein